MLLMITEIPTVGASDTKKQPPAKVAVFGTLDD